MKRFVPLLALWSFACAPATRGAPPSTAAAAATVVEGADDNVLSQTVRGLAEVILAEGYQLRGPIERGFLAPSARALQPLSIPPQTCLAVVALATPAIADLDAALYAADGTVLAEDDAADARPMLRLCSGREAISAYLSLYAFQGTGTYALAQLVRPASAEEAGTLGDSEPSGSAAFLELVRALRSRGYRDEGPGTDLPLVEGSPLRMPSKVAPGQCYSVVADGERLRVRLLDEEGHEVALGVGADLPAALQYCAQRAGDFTLEVSAQGRARTAHLLRLRAAQSSVGGARAIWLGEPSAAAARRPISKSAKTSGCVAHAAPVLQRRPLSQGDLIELPWSAPAGCTLVEAQLHAGLSRVTMRIEREDGLVLAESELAEQGALRACDVARAARLVLIGRGGFGAVSVAQKSCDH